MNQRDKSGNHKGDYHGNFIPQIPNQLLRRFTRMNDIVIDAFLGSGTTLIECERLGRIGIGIELNPKVCQLANDRLNYDKSMLYNTTQQYIINGDSRTNEVKSKVKKILNENNRERAQLLIMHPPYHDIIRFSDSEEDLSNCKTLDDFLNQCLIVLHNFIDLIDNNRHIAVVIGDKYYKQEWIPLGFYLMNSVLTEFSQSLILKSIIIKNMCNNRAKQNQEHLWRYRALVGGFYIFKHEYIILFKKTRGIKNDR